MIWQLRRKTWTHTETFLGIPVCVGVCLQLAVCLVRCMFILVMLCVHMLIHSVCICACVCREREREPEAALRGSGLPCSSTSGLYIRPLINPEWRPGSDRLTGPAPVQDRAWFITTELQPALIYFRLRRGESKGVCLRKFEGGHRNSTVRLEGGHLKLRQGE